MQMSQAEFRAYCVTHFKLGLGGGQVLVPIDWIVQPDVDKRTRGLNDKHVNKLKGSFRSTGTKNKNMTVVFYVDLLKNPEHAHLIDFAKGSALTDLKGLESGLQVISGAHSTEALRSLSKQYPHSDFWKGAYCDVFIFPVGPVAARFTTLEGMASNTSSELCLPMTCYDKVKRIRQIWMEFNKLTKQNKSDLMESMKMNQNTFGQYKMMATLPQECFDEFAKIFTKPATHDYKLPQPYLISLALETFQLRFLFVY